MLICRLLWTTFSTTRFLCVDVTSLNRYVALLLLDPISSSRVNACRRLHICACVYLSFDTDTLTSFYIP
jgi:hypothetical protein